MSGSGGNNMLSSSKRLYQGYMAQAVLSCQIWVGYESLGSVNVEK